jgi:hypothetical protein
MWFVDTAMGGFGAAYRDPDDQSAFAHWARAGAMFVRPWGGRPDQYDNTLAQIQGGDPVFAYEHGIGVVAIGRVCSPKSLIDIYGPTALYPRDTGLIKALAVDWDTSVTRTARQVWEVTALGGPVLKSAGSKTAFFPMAMDMLQDAHDRFHADPDGDEGAALKRIVSSPAYTPKMKAQLGQARIGQGQFRKAVQMREPACRVTRITQSAYLVASHIKPWAVCAGAEHLDGANGLMLAPHIDHLFDTGRISFSDGGGLLLAPGFDPAILRAWNIDENLNVGPFAFDQARYLAYHRQYVLGQPRPRRQRNLIGECHIPTGDDIPSADDTAGES